MAGKPKPLESNAKFGPANSLMAMVSTSSLRALHRKNSSYRYWKDS
jgi:hypothetical protein